MSETLSVDVDFARHYIDTLQMLEEKTKGNVSTEEAQMLEYLLNDLRMTFVALKN